MNKEAIDTIRRLPDDADISFHEHTVGDGYLCPAGDLKRWLVVVEAATAMRKIRYVGATATEMEIAMRDLDVAVTRCER